MRSDEIIEADTSLANLSFDTDYMQDQGGWGYGEDFYVSNTEHLVQLVAYGPAAHPPTDLTN